MKVRYELFVLGYRLYGKHGAGSKGQGGRSEVRDQKTAAYLGSGVPRRAELSITGYQLKGKIIKLEGEEQSIACLLAKAFGLGNLGRVRW